MVCGGQVAAPARGRRPSFCSGKCRVKAHRVRKRTQSVFPAELVNRDRWIRHADKRPATVEGRWCSVTDDHSWATFDDAASSEFGDGLGFVLNGDGIVCIDLDDCVVDGVPNQAARDFLARLPKTFVEFSPSGRGLHVWGFASLSAGRRFERDGLKIEVYPDGRYLTVTGRALVNRPFASLDLAWLVA